MTARMLLRGLSSSELSRGCGCVRKNRDASVSPRQRGRRKERSGKGARGKEVRKGEAPQGTVAHQHCSEGSLQNWGAGGRCGKKQQGKPPQVMDADRKSSASGFPFPQGPQGLGEGLRKERRVLTLYHSGVVDIDHDGGALRGLLSVWGDG